MQVYQQDRPKSAHHIFLLIWVVFLPVDTLIPDSTKNDLYLEHPPSSM